MQPCERLSWSDFGGCSDKAETTMRLQMGWRLAQLWRLAMKPWGQLWPLPWSCTRWAHLSSRPGQIETIRLPVCICWHPLGQPDQPARRLLTARLRVGLAGHI